MEIGVLIPALINPFHATGLFLCALKTLENLWFSGFLMFSVGIERDQLQEVN